MTSSCANVIIILLWFVGVAFGFSDFLVSLPSHLRSVDSRLFYCEAVYVSWYGEEFTVFIIATVCLVLMLALYIRIYLHIRRHHAPGECAHDVMQRLNDRRSRRALVTTLLILGSFVVCWLPTCVFQVTLITLVQLQPTNISPALQYVLKNVDNLLYNLLLVNSICDVIIYTLRCKEVRLGYRRLCCCICERFSPRRNVMPRQTSAMTSATQTGSFASPLNGLRQSSFSSNVTRCALTSSRHAKQTNGLPKMAMEGVNLVNLLE